MNTDVIDFDKGRENGDIDRSKTERDSGKRDQEDNRGIEEPVLFQTVPPKEYVRKKSTPKFDDEVNLVMDLFEVDGKESEEDRLYFNKTYSESEVSTVRNSCYRNVDEDEYGYSINSRQVVEEERDYEDEKVLFLVEDDDGEGE